MVSDINQTPKALRLHIGVFGSTNAGKSTLINAISGQQIALTSPVAGTTTDPVFKPMELLPLGPVVFIDTAGLDDTSELGNLRVKTTLSQLNSCDAAIYVIASNNICQENIQRNIAEIRKKNIPLIVVCNQFSDEELPSNLDFDYIMVNLHKNSDIIKVKDAIIDALKDKIEDPVLTGDLVKAGDLVMLTAPQDIQAPKGRLILPEVQILRDLLDNGCMVMTVTAQNISNALNSLKEPPALVITDSQIFGEVNQIIPKNVRLTSFSMLMAKIKGDIGLFIQGAEAIDSLEDGDRVVILESCSHHALKDDIAREKLPALLRKYTKKEINILNVSGQEFPNECLDAKLAIHCGGCMVNRNAMLSKQRKFEDAGIPMTNFGVAIAYMNGILDRVCY